MEKHGIKQRTEGSEYKNSALASRTMLEQDPGNPRVWQVAAAQAADARDWSELLRIGSAWTQTHPHAIDAWQALSRAHFEESRFDEAIAAFAKVLQLEPDKATHLISAARLAVAAHRYDTAKHYLTLAQQRTPDSGELLYTWSRLYHLSGDLTAAADYCRRAIAVIPGFAPAYVSLGTLCEGKLNDTEIQAIIRLLNDSATHPEYRAMLAYTLGDALDSRDDVDAAFKAWELANSIERKIVQQERIVYDPERIEKECHLLRELFAEPLQIQLRAPSSSGYPRPIFVVGMPRSATTLIESILASHSTVQGAGELPTLYDLHEDLMDVAIKRGIDAARDLLLTQANTWRERYLAALPSLASASSVPSMSAVPPADSVPGATHVVDKQPLNFRSVGLIRLLFPDSPIIYTKRDPMDVGLSIYRHKFSKNWPCAHSLGDIGHYYSVHVRIVDFWLQRHPQAIHVVDHAQLVADSETEIRRLLSFANLGFEPACLTPHNTKRAVATFSSVQVQRPVSAAYSGRAARYVRQLGPLHDALMGGGINPANGMSRFML